MGQENKKVNDSLRTLKILKQTLDDFVEENKVKESASLEIEIDGLIMDETITKVGRDFYDMFYSIWEAPKTAKNYTITVKEMIIPGLASQITVLVNETMIFRQRVQPRYEVLEQMSKFANQATLEFLNNYEKMKAQLEGADQQGTGIF